MFDTGTKSRCECSFLPMLGLTANDFRGDEQGLTVWGSLGRSIVADDAVGTGAHSLSPIESSIALARKRSAAHDARFLEESLVVEHAAETTAASRPNDGDQLCAGTT
jgi:hypothetical protein